MLVLSFWSVFAWGLRSTSIKEDETTDKSIIRKLLDKKRVYAAVFLPVAGFSSAYVIWQMIMSVDPHWYSTLFAWYVTVSVFVSAVAVIIMIALCKVIRLLRKLYKRHLHDLGKYLFGWYFGLTYGSQYLLIWYANNGEET